MTTPQIPITYYGDAPSPIEAGQRYASHPNELVAPAIINGFALTSQVTEGTMDTIDGSDDVGLVIDGATYIVPAATATSNAALVAALNAIPALAATAAVTNPAGATLRLNFLDYQAHEVTSYSPGTPDVTGITNTVEASDPQFVPYGCALITDAAAGDSAAAVVSAASYDPDNGFTFAGLLARANGDRHSDEQVRLLGYVQGVTEGLAPSLHADCVEVGLFKCALGSTPGAAVRGGIPYFETASGANCGKWYASAGGTEGTSQISTLTITPSATDTVGFHFDALPALTVTSVDLATDNQALVDLFNGNAQYAAIGSAAVDAGTIVIEFSDFVAHTFADDSSGGTADVAHALTQAAVAPVAATRIAAPGCRWGRAHASSATVGYLEIGVHP